MPETIKIEVSDLQKMSAAFKKLEGNKDKAYDLSVDVAWNMAKNESLFDRELKRANKQKGDIFRKHNITPGMNYGLDREASFTACMAEIDELESKEITIEGILIIKRSELQKKAQIPSTVMSALMPILSED